MFFSCTGAHALEYDGGMAIDSSSNVLMRTGGKAGTMTSLYGDIGHVLGNAAVLYGFDGGLLNRYEGVQFHYHNLNGSYTFVPAKDVYVNAGLEYTIARYGEVISLRGYNQYGIFGRLRSYLSTSTLLRSEVTLRRRGYRKYDAESYTEAGTFLRLDRFFASRTTLRGQLDLGNRRYSSSLFSHDAFLLGIKARVAQSLGDHWGVWLETRNHTSYFHSRDNDTVNDGVDDSAPVTFDRVFLDDRYKYSSYGLAFHTKYIFARSGNIQFETSLSRKIYDSSQTALYWYLPGDGWKEWEWGAFFSISYTPEFCPGIFHPTLQVYHVAADASVADLSYDSSGFSLSFDIY